MTNLEPAIMYFKTQAALARALGLEPMAVSQWKKRGIPTDRAIEIEKITRGRVRASELKPDKFKSLRR